MLETVCSGMLSILAFLSVVFWIACAELLGWAGWSRYGVLGGFIGVPIEFVAATLLTWVFSPKR